MVGTFQLYQSCVFTYDLQYELKTYETNYKRLYYLHVPGFTLVFIKAGSHLAP